MQLNVTRPLDDLKDEAISKLKEDAFNHITTFLPIHKQINMLERYIDLKLSPFPLNAIEQKELGDITDQQNWKNDIIDEVKAAENGIRKALTHHTIRGTAALAKSSFLINTKEKLNANK